MKGEIKPTRGQMKTKNGKFGKTLNSSLGEGDL